MTEEEQEAIAELQSRIDGLQAVLGVALNLLPQEVVLDRLQLIEKSFRARNMSSGAIEVVGSFRKIWQTPADDDTSRQDK